jgi:hypothetical protein
MAIYAKVRIVRFREGLSISEWLVPFLRTVEGSGSG